MFIQITRNECVCVCVCGETKLKEFFFEIERESQRRNTKKNERFTSNMNNEHVRAK